MNADGPESGNRQSEIWNQQSDGLVTGNSRPWRVAFTLAENNWVPYPDIAQK
jgi:hypothetical protein